MALSLSSFQQMFRAGGWRLLVLLVGFISVVAFSWNGFHLWAFMLHVMFFLAITYTWWGKKAFWLRWMPWVGGGKSEIERSLPWALRSQRHFILPTIFGSMVGLVMFIGLLSGLNYHNRMGIALGTMMIATFAGAIIVSSRPLRHLEVHGVHWLPNHAGKEGILRVTLLNKGKHPLGIAVRAMQGPLVSHLVPERSIALLPQQATCIELPLPADTCGVFPLPQLRFATSHPFGVAWAWTFVTPHGRAVVYPALLPEQESLPLPPGAALSGAHLSQANGREEIVDVRTHRTGDSWRDVAWKATARTQILQTRLYAQPQSMGHSLDHTLVAHLHPEKASQQLARWIEQAKEVHAPWCLSLPDTGPSPSELNWCELPEAAWERLAYWYQDHKERGVSA